MDKIREKGRLGKKKRKKKRLFLQEQMSVLKGKGREEKLSAFPSSLAD